MQQKSINPAHMQPNRCQIIKYSVLLGGTYTEQSSYRQLFVTAPLQGGADKSLAWPGRKQATVTKLGIYSTYPHEAQYTS